MNRVVINSVEESRNFLEPVVWKRDRANGNKQANRRSYEVSDVRGRKSNVGGLAFYSERRRRLSDKAK